MIPDEFREHIIRPTLRHLARRTSLALDTQAAENLLLGTAIQESGLRHLTQIGGPALSFFQIEPATFSDVYDRYLIQNRQDILYAVNGFLVPALTPMDQLVSNSYFSCAVARVKYWMSPAPLPPAEDIDAMGVYWKAHYNSEMGKGTAAQWALNYRKYVKGGIS